MTYTDDILIGLLKQRSLAAIEAIIAQLDDATLHDLSVRINELERQAREAEAN